jgi:acyl carrier protein
MEINKNLEIEIKKIISEATSIPIKKITPNTGMGRNYQWDSLAHVRILLALEKKFKKFKINEINELSSFKKILIKLKE